MYTYYRCHKCNANYKAENLNSEIESLIGYASMSAEMIDEFQSYALKLYNEQVKSKTDGLTSMRTRLSELRANLDNVEEKYIHNRLEYSTYEKWVSKYTIEIASLELQISEAQAAKTENIEAFLDFLPKMADISTAYRVSDGETKRKLIRLLFRGGLTKSKTCYRTAGISDVFNTNLLDNSNLVIVQNIDTSDFFAQKSKSGRNGDSIEPQSLLSDLLTISKLLAA